MLKLTDLTLRPDLQLGPMLVSPSRRLVEGPGGFVHVEPLIMQVFLLLLDAGGRVVTRNELFDQCWGGVYVGDDSLNRAIAKVRRTGAQIAPGLYEIETIPRTGYRLTGEILDLLKAGPPTEAPQPHRLSRRRLVAGAAAGATVIAGSGLMLRWHSGPRRARALVARARSLIYRSDPRMDLIRSDLEQAVRLDPRNASAWGLLALFYSMLPPWRPGADTAMADHVRNAAGKALAIDPREPSALLAQYELEFTTLDWFTRDQRLRAIIAIDPTHVQAISELVALLQSAGMSHESWKWNERAIQLEPLSEELQSRRAMKLWIARRYEDADRVIDLARDTWPHSPYVWWVRFLLLATTGRAAAAKAMFDAGDSGLPPPWTALWRPALPALVDPTPEAMAAARQGCRDAAKTAGALAIEAVMILGALNLVDDAFAITDGFLLWRGSVVRVGKNKVQQLGTDSGWRTSVQWLFTPPTAVLRRDPRFMPLCKGIGLVEYWQKRGVEPDFMAPAR